MSEDNLIYLAAGGIVLYMLLKRNTAAIPTQPGYSMPNYNTVNTVQPSQSVVLPLISTAGSIISKLLNAGSPNAGNTLPQNNTVQDSVNQLSQPTVDLSNQVVPVTLSNTVLPYNSTYTNDPTGNATGDVYQNDFNYL